MPIILFASVTASVTDFFLDPIVNAGTDFISSTGLPAVFVLMLLESACLPVPSEAIMLFAGASVAAGDLTLFGVVAAGVLGNLVGSWIAWGVGYLGRVDLLEKNRLIHLPPKYLKWADDWFERYGDATVFFSRMLPIIRTFISLPAGVAKMPFWRFTIFTFLGCLPWMFMLTYIGMQVGSRWEEWKDSLHYVDYGVAAIIVLAAVYLFVKWRRGGGPGAARGPGAEGGIESAADAPRL